MTKLILGELWDKLQELQEAYKAVTDAEKSLRFGGSPSTIAAKEAWLQHTKQCLETLREEEIKL